MDFKALNVRIVCGLLVLLVLTIHNLVSFESPYKDSTIEKEAIDNMKKQWTSPAAEEEGNVIPSSPFDEDPRIVLLAGPHKTGTTSLQLFFTRKAGLTVALLESTNTTIKIVDGRMRVREPHKKIVSLSVPNQVDDRCIKLPHCKVTKSGVQRRFLFMVLFFKTNRPDPVGLFNFWIEFASLCILFWQQGHCQASLVCKE